MRNERAITGNYPVLRSGCRESKNKSSWINWYVYKPDYPIEAIKEEFSSYFTQPGGMYAKQPCIRVSSTRILVTQTIGFDV